ncbi:hypothetical protein MRS76_05070 [Rhizobiaceae bacterium n13]|uniref:Hemolysin-type calcium-binding repeat-containing protein n=1 Tax=Ferirhizobium litorale TaxID=2927786 RepID=A0AAE3Q929_9HYPH|nr:calcium-binding protein [Fererhizobium litorale]MDI7861320.1 hypothetical protein [Fererhizobium litorale]MDI7921467.1 hypothetical protein [Fererhizobium litorale]
MAKFTAGSLGGNGYDLRNIDLQFLADYDNGDYSGNRLRFFDDDQNYTEFSVSGLVYSGTPGTGSFAVTSGTINAIAVVTGNVKVLDVADADFSAKTLFDLYAAANYQGVLNYILAGSDAITGSNAADYLLGLAGADTIMGGYGIDTILGGVGNDKLFGGYGADRIEGGNGGDLLNGGNGEDKLFGGLRADKLYGGAGNDGVYGGEGTDTLDGGAGNDLLQGGVGGDQFVFKTGYGIDRIADFQDGIDKVNLKGVSSIANFADLQEHMAQVGASVEIDFDGGDVLKIADTTIAELDKGDFLL